LSSVSTEMMKLEPIITLVTLLENCLGQDFDYESFSFDSFSVNSFSFDIYFLLRNDVNWTKV